MNSYAKMAAKAQAVYAEFERLPWAIRTDLRERYPMISAVEMVASGILAPRAGFAVYLDRVAETVAVQTRNQ